MLGGCVAHGVAALWVVGPVGVQLPQLHQVGPQGAGGMVPAPCWRLRRQLCGSMAAEARHPVLQSA
ncbi:hypothetical protein SEA_FULBRIGHT_67 [Mycobacterium phage Fulbright]|uniref:Uncharacterized protein n=1 Tax=Mycobacterium phage Fulbright TaxID=2588511 RepID=A0A4Y6EWS2_9CAUD|nr:hypothetical protein KD932_gp67 [Mycobacterium phage Fulbright]QDF19884.1 hypothetical protein SEA_FULBRIGHT_67 [Mycobacterium phage Fulbright]